MKSMHSAADGRYKMFWAVLGATLLSGICAASVRGQTGGSDVYRVEEDWQLVVNEPDVSNNGPQVTCTFSPADMSTAYCAIDINYHTQPEYVPGGVQLHTWDPSDLIMYASSKHQGVMATSGETVTWTQRMSWRYGRIYFSVRNGSSQTWGSFGGTADSLRLNIGTWLPNLNSYSPDVSIANSGVSFCSNKVASLTLTAVRCYDSQGNLIGQNNTPHVVYPQN